MAIGIVHVLEMIDINQNDRQWLVLAVGPIDLTLDKILDRIVIQQSSQRITPLFSH
ncbi:hypothetical protein GALL_555080 [mine drainage metagenome]|uniref:Uncharacterized protein n=1 Tax=mine drainage metagenome TaxID=410659 RepID=A0A1J5P6B7_9ZZZZ